MKNKKVTTFYIVRHGETDWNVAQKLQGITDIPMNANGELQASETARKLKNVHFDLAFSSDLLRAVRTAEIIALEHKLEVQATELLRERSFGELEGKTYDAIKAYDEYFRTLEEDKKWKHKYVSDMESDADLVMRLTTFLRETAITHPGKTVLVGTHGGIMRIFLAHLGYLPYDGSWGAVHNGSYVKLLSDGVEFEIADVYNIEIPAKK